MKRGKPIKRKTPLRKRNAKRAAKRKAEAFGPQAELCRTLPCCVCWQASTEEFPTHPHHEGHSRGAGGKDRECIPMCWRCHAIRHSLGRESFWKHCRIDPRTVLAGLRARVAREAA